MTGLPAMSRLLVLAELFPSRSNDRAARQNRLAGMIVALALTAQSVGAPTFTLAPANVSVVAGQNATFTASATGAGTLTYQWRRHGTPITGQTDTTFVVGGATRGDADDYDVVASDSTGSTASPSAHLSVAPRSYPGFLVQDPSRRLSIEWGRGVTINSVAATADGGYVAGGQMASVNDIPRSLVARFNADNTLNATFVSPEFVGSEVLSVAVQPDGKILAAGRFEYVGAYKRNGLVRLNPDGSVDTTFVPAIDLSTGGGWVTKVLVQGDGKILIVSPGELGLVRRLNPDGGVDRVFVPGTVGQINDIAVQPDGRLLVAGWYTAWVAGVNRQNLARFNADGSIDTSFDAGSTSGTPLSIAVAPDGRIYVGGNFTGVGGATVSGLARLNADGGVDSTFSPKIISFGGTGEVRTVTVQTDGTVVIGGQFDTVNGTTAWNAARITGAGTLQLFSKQIPFVVESVAILSGGDIVAGAAAGGAVNNTNQALSRFTSAGVDAQLNATFRRYGTIQSAAVLPGGKVLLIGSFDLVQGQPAKGIIRLNGDGTLDTSFTAKTALADRYSTPWLSVSASVALPDGRVVVAGNYLGSQNYPLGFITIVDPDGTLEAGFTMPSGLVPQAMALLPTQKLVAGGYNTGSSNASLWTFDLTNSATAAFSTGTAFNGGISSLLAEPDGRILVSGAFTSYNGTPANSIARLNSDGSLDSAFTANSQFIGSSTKLMALLPNGEILATGIWPTTDTGLMYLVRLNADGSRDLTFHNPNLPIVDAAIVQEDGKILARADSWDEIIRLNGDGTSDQSFDVAQFYTGGGGSVLIMRDDGQLLLNDDSPAGGRLFESESAAIPSIASAPTSQVVTPGGNTTLSVTANSLLPVSYQWLFNGQPIAGATNSSYTIAAFAAGAAGNYSVRLTNDFGTTTTTPIAVAAPAESRGRLFDVSVRTIAGANDATLIVGVVLGGAGTGGTRPLLFRGVGPTLATTFGVAGALADPYLQIFDSTGYMIDQNDDWRGVFNFASVGAFPFAGSMPKDAAVYNPYAALGAQTMHVVGKNDATGIALAEAYTVPPSGGETVFTPRLINGSARAMVRTDAGVLILGFVVGGSTSERLLIRAVGPTLADAPFNVGGVLANPMLEIYDSSGTKLLENDDWGANGADATLSPIFNSVGAFPFDSASSKDAALVATLAPGAYSAVVRGVGGTTGVALVEVYEVP